MRRTGRQIDPLPEEFATAEEAAEFWDAHDTADYLDAFVTVEADTELRGRYYEVALAEDVGVVLRTQARQLGVPMSDLASRLLRQQLTLSGS